MIIRNEDQRPNLKMETHSTIKPIKQAETIICEANHLKIDSFEQIFCQSSCSSIGSDMNKSSDSETMKKSPNLDIIIRNKNGLCFRPVTKKTKKMKRMIKKKPYVLRKIYCHYLNNNYIISSICDYNTSNYFVFMEHILPIDIHIFKPGYIANYNSFRAMKEFKRITKFAYNNNVQELTIEYEEKHQNELYSTASCKNKYDQWLYSLDNQRATRIAYLLKVLCESNYSIRQCEAYILQNYKTFFGKQYIHKQEDETRHYIRQHPYCSIQFKASLKIQQWFKVEEVINQKAFDVTGIDYKGDCLTSCGIEFGKYIRSHNWIELIEDLAFKYNKKELRVKGIQNPNLIFDDEVQFLYQSNGDKLKGQSAIWMEEWVENFWVYKKVYCVFIIENTESY